ncbi:TetR/AcrR family transcriptional regulator [soil metagenome]
MAESNAVSRTGSGALTKEAIGRAARRLFHRHGYVGTSVRAIAAEAGADPALVIRHFGSKERLFLETVAIEGRFEHVTTGPLESLGARLVESLLTDMLEQTASTWRAMLRATDSDLVRSRLIHAMEQMFIEPLAPRLVGPDAELRARLVAAQISGLLDALAILADRRITEAAPETLVRLYGASIQTLIDGPGSGAGQVH